MAKRREWNFLCALLLPIVLSACDVPNLDSTGGGYEPAARSVDTGRPTAGPPTAGPTGNDAEDRDAPDPID